MQEEHLKYLRCPECRGEFSIEKINYGENKRIKDGILICNSCQKSYPIYNYIPRFVQNTNYADNFGFEWTIHSKTQYDSVTHINISETRFFYETVWGKNLEGQIILEAGSGSGRFTEIALKTKAMVVSFDYSNAVDVNYLSNGHCKNLLLIQADIYNMPFQEKSFDKILCFGMLQHTPDVKKSFMKLPPLLKPTGELVIDVYAKLEGFINTIRSLFITKYWIRPITKKISHIRLYKICSVYLNFVWPIAKQIQKIPTIGSRISHFFLIPDYLKKFNLPEKLAKEWILLDIFDALSPMYDYPKKESEIKRWFLNAGLEAEIRYFDGNFIAKGIKK